MNYDSLKAFGKDVLTHAYNLNIDYDVYWYSPHSRLVNPTSKIGFYDSQPHNIVFTQGCRLIVCFPGTAFTYLGPIINSYLPFNKQIALGRDYRSKDGIGFDVYQRVVQLKLYIELNNVESKRVSLKEVQTKFDSLLKYQLTASKAKIPLLNQQQIQQEVDEVSQGLKRLQAYLRSMPGTTVQLRRNSGIRHKSIVVKDFSETTRKRFSNMVFAFGKSQIYKPAVELPKEPNPTRKTRSDSVSARYYANPLSFKYYDKFGIYEVYDE